MFNNKHIVNSIVWAQNHFQSTVQTNTRQYKPMNTIQVK